MARKKVILSQRAIKNLFEIESYILSNFGIIPHREFQKLFEAYISLLTEFPKIAPMFQKRIRHINNLH